MLGFRTIGDFGTAERVPAKSSGRIKTLGLGFGSSSHVSPTGFHQPRSPWILSFRRNGPRGFFAILRIISRELESERFQRVPAMDRAIKSACRPDLVSHFG